MAVLIAIPVIAVLTMLQVGVISRISLLQGSADLVMLGLIAWSLHERVKTAWIWGVIGGGMVSMISALPYFAPMWGYLAVVGLTRLIRRRVWQTPLLAMLIMTFFGSLITLGMDWFVLQFRTGAYPIQSTLNLIIMPSILLNLLLAIPMYAVINDIADFIFPEEVNL